MRPNIKESMKSLVQHHQFVADGIEDDVFKRIINNIKFKP